MTVKKPKKYLIKKVTDYFEEEKPERIGRIVYWLTEPEEGKPALLFYDNDFRAMAFKTSIVQDIHWMRTIITGELEMVLETENSIYHLIEVKDGQTEGE